MSKINLKEKNWITYGLIGISIIAIPVFFTLASILTFVFVGFHKEEKRLSKTSAEK